MQKLSVALLLAILSFSVQAQQTIQRPKLIVGIVVDQMRWDYLYRFYDRYAPNGGFKRMLNQGFACENTLIPYTPTYTGCGHSSIYTGSVPAINGITGNFWWDSEQMRSVYCTEDKSVNTVGSNSTAGKQSPRNLLTTTICDELKIATNFKSKIVGISLKDRGGILPAGHSANAAYWYDNSVGKWITSTYYMNELPTWVNDFNDKKLVDKYYEQGWGLLYPAASYIQSTSDQKSYEANTLGGNTFPYDLKKYAGKDYTKISTTPMGNTLTAEFAKASIVAEQLGKDNITDFLAISFSSPDYIGHSYGPNSIESEDGFLRLDKELGSLLDFLDNKVGKGQYTVFLSADHGVANIPEFMKENKLPGGRIFMNDVTKEMNTSLNEKYKISNIIMYDDNYQLALNHPALDSAQIDTKKIISWIVDNLGKNPAIARVFPLDELNKVPLPATVRTYMNNGYYKKRSGDIQFMLKPNFIDAWSNTGTTHGLWNPYDTHIPLLWYGWGIKQGKTNRETYMSDIAPTIAALLRIQAPNGNIGQVITEVIK
ncbi:MAG: alkaline phosphatase family protein [Chitinophagaceae bacterium]|jgi:predicted AlkP superfamily pyrophosphatase or phosphodiesterase|nr:alkaline phosphatase family protein [Chitinophagaceae bacterium]MBK8299329.1 alkaline phosphatase family protein [Chitinophagaceae bacterium]MBL0068471.1 alkaline phosphatase family protein [Chitinophagaceae bacterium]MBP6233390.1 alkaline phosphatase family protein [Chitinophagaceae bacterium]